MECATEQEQKDYFERTVIGLDSMVYEASIDERFSKYLNMEDFKGKQTQDNLIKQNKKYIWFSSKAIGIIPYVDIGISST